MSQSTTINYYDTHAAQYFAHTHAADLASSWDRFLSYIPRGGRIIDIGSGSGRDMKYFSSKGYQTEGLDASAAMCQRAAQYTGLPVTHSEMQDWRPRHLYDGIWLCASLLHLTENEILKFMQTACQALTAAGIVFISAKQGIPTGYDQEGRYFTDFSEEMIRRITCNTRELVLREQWYTKDKLNRGDITWVNLICQREGGASHECI